MKQWIGVSLIVMSHDEHDEVSLEEGCGAYLPVRPQRPKSMIVKLRRLDKESKTLTST